MSLRPIQKVCALLSVLAAATILLVGPCKRTESRLVQYGRPHRMGRTGSGEGSARLGVVSESRRDDARNIASAGAALLLGAACTFALGTWKQNKARD